jgi:hypothetical protein
MEEPRFNAMKVCEKLIPSVVSARSMWQEIPDKKSKLAFVKMSNLFIASENKLFNPDFFLPTCNKFDKEILQLSSKRNGITEDLCELLDVNFGLYMQSRALARWHEYVRGNLTCVDIQVQLKTISTRRQIAEGKKEWESWKPKPSEEFFSLVKCHDSELSSSWWLAQEYSLAKSYELTFISMSEILSKRVPVINKLVQIELDIDKRIYEIIQKQKSISQKPLNYLYRCRFCNRISIVEQGKTSRNCGSKKCEDDYQVERKNANRPPKTPKGWEPDFGGKRRDCLSCGEKRQVTRGNCRECLLKALRDKA